MSKIISKKIKKINKGPIFDTQEEMDSYTSSSQFLKDLDESAKGSRYTMEQVFGPLFKKIEKQKANKLFEAGFNKDQVKLVQSIYAYRPTYRTV